MPHHSVKMVTDKKSEQDFKDSSIGPSLRIMMPALIF